ncbi:MAG TPA: DUF308 domain-containing protein [Thermotogota bacterium]|mgnify:CR=1 FL=1|nr:DUF308 domain-containing protein [Thermotogota bacterium]HRW34698.1 DUF308 domain-containing protein [Thermotogota bacterium]
MKKMYTKTFQTIMAEKWWQGLLLGFLFLAFGVLLLVWPNLTSDWIIRIIGVVALIFGLYRLFQMLFYKEEKATQPKSMLVVEAAAGIVIGFFAFLMPSVIAVAILVILAVWMLYYGFFDFWTGFSIPKGKASNLFKWMLVLCGLLSLAVGIFLLVNFGSPIKGLVGFIAAYAVAFGGLNCVMAFFHPNRKSR